MSTMQRDVLSLTSARLADLARSAGPPADLVRAAWVLVRWRLDDEAKATFAMAPGASCVTVTVEPTLRFAELVRKVGALAPSPGAAGAPVILHGNTAQAGNELDETAALAISIDLADHLVLTARFNSARHARSDVTRTLSHLAAVLGRAASQPQLPAHRLPLTTPAEVGRLLGWGVGPVLELPLGAVHEVVDEVARVHPEHLAVVADDGGELTYGELVERSLVLARVLVGRGVRVGDLVGVCLGRGVDLVVALLAVLRAGGGYLPLDPDYPRQRLDFMVADAEPVLVVGGSVGELPVVRVDEVAPSDVVLPKVGVESVAYCLYTSGSTGQPKGVLVPHRAVVRLAVGMSGVRLDRTCRMLQLAPVNFDASTVEVWGALVNGAVVVAYPPGTPSVAELRRVLAEHRVTTAVMATALTNSVIDADVGAFEPLRQLMIGGEAMSVPHIRQAMQRLPGTEFFNGYGPTESTSFTAMFSVPRDLPADAESVPLGGPIGGTQVVLLDQWGDLVPVGVPGELCIGGDGLALEYLRRPGLTAQKFRANEFGVAGSRLYHSGDLARWLPDGTLDFVGRVDDQVKVRGFRVEPGEVVAALLGCPGVADAFVLAQRGRTHARLVAYYVTADGVSLPVALMRDYLSSVVPDYMVPAAFVHLERLPLTVNGKVDRSGLRDPDQVVTVPRSAGESAGRPASMMEQTLVRIWSGVLGVSQVAVDDNFFDLGGDSIHAIQIVARLREENISLTPRQIFERPTITELAEVVEEVEGAVVEQGVVSGSLGVGAIQGWFFGQGLVSPGHFNQAVVFGVSEDFEVAALQQAVHEVLLHHDALRVRASVEDGRWRMWLAGAEAADPAGVVQVVEAGPGRLAEVGGRAQASLELTSGPVVRVVVAVRDGVPWRVIVVVHHLAIDAVSWPVLVQDLTTAYQAVVAGESVRLPVKTSSYRRWLEHVAEHAVDPVVRDSRGFWERALAGAGEAVLPPDLPGGPVTAGDGDVVRVVLPVESTQALMTHSGSYRMRPDEVVLAAVAAAARACTGGARLCLALENNGRYPFTDDVDLSRTVGWFTALYPLGLELPADPGDLGALLRAVKDQSRAVPGHGLGYGLLRYVCDESIAGGAWPSMSFNYIGGLLAPQTGPGGPFSPVAEDCGLASDPANRRPHLIDVLVSQDSDQLHVTVWYSTVHYQPQTIVRFGKEIESALHALIAHCQNPDHHGVTGSDFPLAGLSQNSLDRIINRLKK